MTTRTRVSGQVLANKLSGVVRMARPAIARRDERASRQYSTAEPRRQARCPVQKMFANICLGTPDTR